MLSLSFGTRFWGSDIVRERFKDLGFRMSEKDLVRRLSGLNIMRKVNLKSSNISIYRSRVVVLL